VVVRASTDAKQAVILEVNCETDFVDNGDDFLAFSGAAADAALSAGVADIDGLMSAMMGDKSVEQARKELVAKIGENINLRRFQRIESAQGTVQHYLHGSRIGVLVDTTGVDKGVGRDVAMHVAASNPSCISEKEVDQALLDKERDIFSAQAEASGKPEAIIEKMVVGRLKKYIGEITLNGQSFIKNPDVTVGQMLTDAGGSIAQFVRFEVGEGIEKVQENFAEEVMAQVRGS
jgi:elongation factor Ts